MEDKIIFYTTNCIKCKILKRKLDDKHVPYTIIKGEAALKAMLEAGQSSAPMLRVNSENKDFGKAIEWVNTLCK